MEYVPYLYAIPIMVLCTIRESRDSANRNEQGAQTRTVDRVHDSGRAVIDLRSDLMGPRSPAVARAMADAALSAPAMSYEECGVERALNEALTAELGVEAVLLVPTCTMANQIAIRLHLPKGGQLAGSPLGHIVTVEARATALTGVSAHPLPAEGGHPSPETVRQFLVEQEAGTAALVWLENTHMLSAGSVIPAGWQERIGAACKAASCAVHVDGSRLWNAAIARNVSPAELTTGCDTVSVSLNKCIGAPVGSVLAGSRAAIQEAVRWRDALGGEWRPIGSIAAAALAALDGWRERLETDAAMTSRLAAAIADRLGEAAVHPAPTNLIFLNVANGAAPRFIALLAARGVHVIPIMASIVRLAIHGGIRDREVDAIVDAVTAAHAELAAVAAA